MLDAEDETELDEEPEVDDVLDETELYRERHRRKRDESVVDPQLQGGEAETHAEADEAVDEAVEDAVVETVDEAKVELVEDAVEETVELTLLLADELVDAEVEKGATGAATRERSYMSLSP